MTGLEMASTTDHVPTLLDIAWLTFWSEGQQMDRSGRSVCFGDGVVTMDGTRDRERNWGK